MTGTTVDFARMLSQLRTLGRDVPEIAMHANVSVSAVRNYAAGTQPLHSNGERLIAFWCEVTGSKRQDCPTIRDMPTVSRSRFLQKHITVR